ncbi:MAG TPA: ATP-binding cassette domain-containing protein, partial [Burkholderiales bacterium]|nr:ATP-binding cassette domain-containing protein [Burkholderiales bacterium]
MEQERVCAAAVSVRALAKRYGAPGAPLRARNRAPIRALEDVSFEVPAADAFGLVGANGAGKTTLIKCMLDLCAFDAGAVEIFGRAARDAGSRARLAYVPERFVPPHYLVAREFLQLMLSLGAVRYEEARARAMFERLELEPGAL